MSVGKSINNVEVSLQYPVLGPLFLLFFLVIVLFILISAFAAILVDAYGEIREEQGETGFVNAELGKYMYNVCIKEIKELPDKISCGKKISYIRQWSYSRGWPRCFQFSPAPSRLL